MNYFKEKVIVAHKLRQISINEQCLHYLEVLAGKKEEAERERMAVVLE